MTDHSENLQLGVFLSPMAEAAGSRALLEPRCGGAEGTEHLVIAFKSSDGYVLIVYELQKQ